MITNEQTVTDIQKEIDKIRKSSFRKTEMIKIMRKFKNTSIEELLEIKDFYGKFTFIYDNFMGEQERTIAVPMLFATHTQFDRLIKENSNYNDAITQSYMLQLENPHMSFIDTPGINIKKFSKTLIENKIPFPVEHLFYGIVTVSDFMTKWKETGINPIEVVSMNSGIKVHNQTPSLTDIEYLKVDENRPRDRNSIDIEYIERLVHAEINVNEFTHNNEGLEKYKNFKNVIENFANLIGDIYIFRKFQEDDNYIMEQLNTRQMIDIALDKKHSILAPMNSLLLQSDIGKAIDPPNNIIPSPDDISDTDSNQPIFKI